MSPSARATRLGTRLAERSAAVITAALVATALLAVPFLLMQPDDSASQEPAGVVFEARDFIEDEFASSVFATFMIIEDPEGDLLRAGPLQAVLAAERALRADPEIGPSLFSYFDTDELAEVVGIQTIADLVDRRIPLETATDREVKEVVAGLIAERGPTDLGLSAKTTTGPDGLPVSPAILTPALSLKERGQGVRFLRD